MKPVKLRINPTIGGAVQEENKNEYHSLKTLV